LIVAELYGQSFVVKPLDDSADLPACKSRPRPKRTAFRSLRHLSSDATGEASLERAASSKASRSHAASLR
jgi:hypothetical protein